MKQIIALVVVLTLFCQSNCLYHYCQHSARENTAFIIEPRQFSYTELDPHHPLRITFDYSSIPDNFAQRDYIIRLCNQASLFFNRNLQVVTEHAEQNNQFPNVQGVFCGTKQIPEQDKSVGIKQSDLHIYVGTFTHGQNNALATSGVCVLGRATKRPSFGYLNINTFHLSTIGDTGKEKDYEDYYEGIIHEMFHVLGFSQSLFPHFKNSLTFENKIVRGQPTTWVTSPKVKEVARKHFNCTDAIGMQLENYNGDNNENQHWKRVLLNNELMTGNYQRPFGLVSIFTWALLEDSGWYFPSYQFMDEIEWGKDRGCSFLDSCDPNKFREFQPYNGRNHVYYCNFYYSAITRSHQLGETQGECQIGTDYLDCQDPGSGQQYDHLTLNIYSQQSRCFNSDIINTNLLTGNENMINLLHFSSRCYQYECTDTGIDVIISNKRFQIKNGETQVYIKSSSPTEEIAGTIYAPENIDAFCNRIPQPCLNYCSRNGYCYGGTCHCDTDYAGEDCSIQCANGNYVYNGVCQNEKSCPENTLFNSQTKQCYIGQPCPEGQVKFGHNCVSECPHKYFQGGQSCVPCLPGCEFCSSQNTCHICSVGYVPDYYHKTCSRCWKGCAQCDGNNCQQCEPDYFPYDSKSIILVDAESKKTISYYTRQCANPCPADSIFIEQQQKCNRCDFQIYKGCKRCSETECFWGQGP